MTTFTQSLRLWMGTPLDPSIRGAWGPPLNENQVLIEAAICDTASVDLTGLTTYTLTTANGAPDQARPLIQNYINAIPGNCTVTLPNEPKVGYAINNTTGGHNVILTAGAGAQATIPPDGRWYPYWADGSTNVFLIPLGLGTLFVSALTAVTGAFSSHVTMANGTGASQGVVYNQFNATISGQNWSHLIPGPNPMLIQGGLGTGSLSGAVGISFPTPFSAAPVNINITVLAGAAGGAGSTLESGFISSTGFNCTIFQTSDNTPISNQFYWEAKGAA